MGIISRGKSYYVRLNVPKSLQAIVGKTEFRRSLKTGRMAEAVRKARIVSTEFEQWLLEAEGKPIEGIAPAALATPSSFKPKTTGKTLRELCEVFLNDPTKNRSGKAISGYGNAVELAEAVLGREKVLGAIERQHCRDIIEVLKWVPSNSKKRFPTLDYMQAAEKSKAEALPLLSPKTVNDYIIKLSSLMNFAIDEGYVDRNPFRGLKVADDVHPRDKRNPFTNKQLRQIFDAPLYRGCVNDQGGYDQSGPNYPRRGRFWIPLIALYSGMRLNEICQLDLADVKTVGGVECFSVTTESARGGKDKKVKTMSSRRLVPIHTKLIEIGFLNYVADRRRQASIKLFPELPISATGYFSDPFSKWFVRFLIKCGAARDAKQHDAKPVHPFILVVTQDVEHLRKVRAIIEGDDFFGGRYKGRVAEIHSKLTGEESDENAQKLLAVETSGTTDIVIHVNKLKEGWDVTNLYTIVPLRASAADTLGGSQRLHSQTKSSKISIDMETGSQRKNICEFFLFLID